MIFEFVHERHEDHGTYGWRPSWEPLFEPLGGMTVAHDCLEHHPRFVKGAAEEIMAFGAMVYTRAVPGYFVNNGPEFNMGGGFPEMFSCYREHGMATAPRVFLRDRDVNDLIDEICSEGRRVIYSELEHGCGDDETQEEMRLEVPAFIENARRYMRLGYRFTRERFGPLREHAASAMFCTIEQEADKQLNWAEVGDILQVKVNFTRCHVDVKVKERKDDY